MFGDNAPLVAKLDSGSPRRAMALYRGGRFEAAAAEFGRGDTAEAHNNRGNALALADNLKAALVAYDAALARSPGMRDALFNRAAVRDALAKRRARAQSRDGEQSARISIPRRTAAAPPGRAGGGRRVGRPRCVAGQGSERCALERATWFGICGTGRVVISGAEFESAQRFAEVFAHGAAGALSASGARTARGPRHELQVREPPAAAAKPWLPVRRLTLEQTWSRDPEALTAGTAVTRTLILRAEGTAAERLPKLEMAPHPALVVHHDQPELVTEYLAEGMSSRRVQRIVLMPVAAADVNVPALRVSWWDVDADLARTATLDGRVLRLHAAVAPVARPRQVGAESPAAVSPWGALAAGSALLTIVLWWRGRTRASRVARRRLKAACRKGDASAARDALRDWGRAVGAAAPQFVQRIGAAWPDAGARAQLGMLEEALYAGRTWDGDALWRAVRPWLRCIAVRRHAPATPRRVALFRLQERGPVRVDVVRQRGGRLPPAPRRD